MRSQIMIAVLSMLVIQAFGQADTNVQATRQQYVCQEGYYWSGEYCFQCLQITNGYCTCNSISGCTNVVCYPYYVNIGTTASPNCVVAVSGYEIDNCATYQLGNSAIVCQTCDEGYQMVGQQCLSTTGCATWSEVSGLCLSCQSGFFYNYNDMTNENSDVCSQCLYGCQTCGSSSTCQSCQSNYLWQIDTDLNNGQGSCQTCSAIGCTQCPYSLQNCTACGTNYYLSGTSNTQSASCELCQTTLEGCATCTSNSTCTSCYSSYYLSNGQCQSCGQNCLTCTNSTVCTVCDSSTQSILANGTCLICPDNCQTCYASNNVAYCSACEDTFYMQSNTTCQACFDQNSDWLRCAGPLDNNLITTLQPTQCQTGFWTVSINGVNQCVAYSTQNNCYAISTTNNQQCSQCLPGYTLVGTNCYQCSSKYPSCQTCSVTNGASPSISCTACQSSYYLSSGSCVACSANCVTCTNANTCSQCQSNYYLNSQSSCTQCAVSNCNVCTSSSCTQCQTGFFLQITGGNTQCNQCPSECLTCNSPGQVCTSCNPGSVLQNGGCVSYVDQNCLYSSSTSGKCIVCAYGYYLNNGRCEVCIDQTAGFVCRNNNGVSFIPGTTPSTNALILNALFIAFLILFSL